MMTTLTKECVEKICQELEKPEHMEKMQQSIIHPIIHYSLLKMAPYFFAILVLLLVMISLNIIVTIQFFKNVTVPKIPVGIRMAAQ